MDLYTERLILRPWQEEDAKALYQHASNPKIGLAAGWSAHQNIEDSFQCIRHILSASETYAVVLKTEGRPVGSIGFIINMDVEPR